MSSAQTSSAIGGYLSNLYERASHFVNEHTGHSEERQPLLHGQSSQEYGSVPDNQIPVPKPRKVQSPVKVEAKVWFANEVGTAFPHQWLTPSVRGFRGCVALSLWARSLLLFSTLRHTSSLSLSRRLLSRVPTRMASCAPSTLCARSALSTR